MLPPMLHIRHADASVPSLQGWLERVNSHFDGFCSASYSEKILMDIPTKKRINISITGEEVNMLEKLQKVLNDKLEMDLSLAQVIKRLVRQAIATEL